MRAAMEWAFLIAGFMTFELLLGIAIGKILKERSR